MITASTFIPSASSGDPWSAAARMEGSPCAPGREIDSLTFRSLASLLFEGLKKLADPARMKIIIRPVGRFVAHALPRAAAWLKMP
jgi:hypothetical protein